MAFSRKRGTNAAQIFKFVVDKVRMQGRGILHQTGLYYASHKHPVNPTSAASIQFSQSISSSYRAFYTVPTVSIYFPRSGILSMPTSCRGVECGQVLGTARLLVLGYPDDTISSVHSLAIEVPTRSLYLLLRETASALMTFAFEVIA